MQTTFIEFWTGLNVAARQAGLKEPTFGPAKRFYNELVEATKKAAAQSLAA